ncbi:MAG: hypothetical protein RBS57_20790, partial [Desulforhabdus sp.]|nr:hypothetical protein [Desulforhabdus sp.]
SDLRKLHISPRKASIIGQLVEKKFFLRKRALGHQSSSTCPDRAQLNTRLKAQCSLKEID